VLVEALVLDRDRGVLEIFGISEPGTGMRRFSAAITPRRSPSDA
jgi:hypothetical protein